MLQKGFTLIELMIVVAIIGILAMIAVPQYKNYTIKSKLAVILQEVESVKNAVILQSQTDGGTPGITNVISSKDAWSELGLVELKTSHISKSSISPLGRLEVTLQNIGTGVDGATVSFWPDAINGVAMWEIFVDNNFTDAAAKGYLTSIDPNKNLTTVLNLQ